MYFECSFQCSRELQLIENGSTSKFYRFVNRTLGSLRSTQPIFDCHSNTLVEDPYKQANIFSIIILVVFLLLTMVLQTQSLLDVLVL